MNTLIKTVKTIAVVIVVLFWVVIGAVVVGGFSLIPAMSFIHEGRWRDAVLYLCMSLPILFVFICGFPICFLELRRRYGVRFVDYVVYGDNAIRLGMLEELRRQRQAPEDPGRREGWIGIPRDMDL